MRKDGKHELNRQNSQSSLNSRSLDPSGLTYSYKTEISSFDVQTGRCDRFGQDEYDSRCVLVYSGIRTHCLTA